MLNEPNIGFRLVLSLPTRFITFFVSAKVIEGPKKAIKIRKAKQTKEEEKSVKAPAAESIEAKTISTEAVKEEAGAEVKSEQ